MPKIVDHDQRRAELVEGTWRIIARDGIESATMRGIAAEAGFANGAVKPYFATKEETLTFAFAHVYDATNMRIASDPDRAGMHEDSIRKWTDMVLKYLGDARRKKWVSFLFC
ncbi:TetR family transcriptional regulator [Arthrobacter sp. ISL-28]|uniref:TetR/AcrR family transcriptional regulator n=1 Tax=Arthrobacter sp. ISL-28 TaxID=2819108 RepID=UPI001BECCFC3|nr:TetR family transcriptional regulator [Arthrobacter sp. ISL-28]MBT2522576.1 TetR family transcriptional regulator [Arthrobacter sp. ISL-28]